ncbi:MAG: hypothetical protein ACK4WH_05840 [Phycisphaerales bacterium]
MVELLESTAVGPYLLTRALAPCAFAERHLALHEPDHSSHVAYRFSGARSRQVRRRLESAISACRQLDHEHLLPVEDVVESDGDVWVMCPFTGDVDGIRTLSKLLREKRGQMDPFEAERAMEQLLDAVAHAHTRVVHGPIRMDDVLVDRHGRLLIEFYGLRRALSGASAAADPEDIRDEVRSIVEIGYQLVTGLRAEEPMIPAGRVVKKLDPAFDRWLSKGLDPAAGFESAAQALAEIPCRGVTDHEFDEPADAEGVRRVWRSPFGGLSGAIEGVRVVIGRLRGVPR